MKRTLFVYILLVLSVVATVATSSFAEQPPAAHSLIAPQQQRGVLAPPDTSSPQATLRSFLENTTQAYEHMQKAYAEDMKTENLFTHTPTVTALAEQAMLYFEKAIQCIDFSKVPSSYRTEYSYETVIELKEILDRIHLPRMITIPSSDAMMETDYWRVPGTPFEIQFVKEGTRSGEYLFNAETINHVNMLFPRAKNLPYITTDTEGFYTFYSSTPGRLVPPKWFYYIPDWLSMDLYYGQTIFQWGTFFLSVLLALGLTILSHRLTRHTKKATEHPILHELLYLVVPLQLVISCLFLAYVFDDIINLTGRFLVFAVDALQIILWISAAWSVMIAGRLFAEIIFATPRIDPRSIDASLVKTVTNLACIFIALCLLFYGGTTLGIPLIPVVTGFGVIGLAISLAARPTIENVIGGLTLFADKPVRIGDFCRFGQTRGRVLHIGLRSTRVRAVDRTIVSIPNAEFAHLQLVNLTTRDKFKVDFDIGLRYETTPTQLRWIITKIQEMLFAHPEISEKPLCWVRFTRYNTFSKDLNIRAYVNTNKVSVFYKIYEDILFRVGDIVEKSGTSFAFPTQAMYFKRDTDLPEEPVSMADELREFAEREGFPFPDFPQERKKRIQRTLHYPPQTEADYTILPADETETEDKKQEPKKERFETDAPATE
ncbi:MAG: mechanosensitive ion channel family protein [Desulfovibrionales bacterium]|nr:mechanosensitive ion channel family protein [Desulfovibrionales bacterium]